MVVFGSEGASAQSPAWWKPSWYLADRLYFEPLVAEPRAARMQIIFPGWSTQFPHSIQPGRRFAWQITLGREIPIIGFQSDTTGLQPLPEGQWGLGLWIPVSFHMIEDFKDESNPIVDTDYRFGFMTKVQYGLSDSKRLGFRFVPWAHESTHLGDEYTILALAQLSFERVNVSFEYYEYAVSFEMAFRAKHLLILRHSGINLWGKDGYYSDHLLGSDESTITPSKANYEPAIGAELRIHPTAGSQGWFLSIDARNKLVYNFHQTLDEQESKKLTWSIALGRAEPLGARTILRQYFVHFYKGVNPYGQLRTQDDFWSLGVGWIFQ